MTQKIVAEYESGAFCQGVKSFGNIPGLANIAQAELLPRIGTPGSQFANVQNIRCGCLDVEAEALRSEIHDTSAYLIDQE
ncbi:MAG: hypothetical protein LC114_03025 [Bryobacterales bacterium]|nr:hypothetical protein [Bryobacterales bacterium]